MKKIINSVIHIINKKGKIIFKIQKNKNHNNNKSNFKIIQVRFNIIQMVFKIFKYNNKSKNRIKMKSSSKIKLIFSYINYTKIDNNSNSKINSSNKNNSHFQ